MLGPNDTNPNAPITIADALNSNDENSKYRGSFLFAPVAPQFATTEAANNFVAAVANWLQPQQTPLRGRYCVWIPDATQTPPVWGSSSFPTGVGNSYAFPFGPQSSGQTISLNFNAMIGGAAGSQLTLTASQSIVITLTAGSTALTFNAFGGSGTFFTTSSGAPTISPNAQLPLTGNHAGCLIVQGSITPKDTFAAFGGGLQFAYGPTSTVAIQTFPVFVPSTTPFNMIAVVDPLDPICTGAASNIAAGLYRTTISVLNSSGSAPTLASFYRTATNQPIGMVPLGGGDPVAGPPLFAGGLVFQPMAPVQTGLPIQPGQVYLAPAGDYALAVAGASASSTLLCGLSGTETIQYQPYATNTTFDKLRFVPGQPAYTPKFPFATATLDVPATGQVAPTLPSPATYLTSWVTPISGVQNGQPLAYHSQPEGSALYGPSGANGDGSDVLGVMNPTLLLAETSVIVPLAPWAGAPMVQNQGVPPSLWATYDSQILSATRRNTILTAKTPAIAAHKQKRRIAALAMAAPLVVPGQITTNATTPQGLLAEIDMSTGHTDYVAVVLAQSDTKNTPASQMAFCNLTTELQRLFQTNQLFAVITDPTYLGDQLGGSAPKTPTDPLFANTVDIADWTMTAAVGQGAGLTGVGNVMILKFCAGTTQDLVANPNKWVDPLDFSGLTAGGSLAALSQQLQVYISDAIAAAETSTLYENFRRIVTDPNWNGILVLSAEILPTGLPPQIEGLAAGINFSEFRAHHFGVTVSPVQATGATVGINGISSFFGLIDYQLPAYQQNVQAGASPTLPLALPTSGDYGFTVLQLQALFENSALVDFRSHIQLTVNALLSSDINACYGPPGLLPANAVVLTGHYLSMGGKATYVFRTEAPTVFVPNSNVIEAVTFDQVVFNTLSADATEIKSRFLIWGQFNFAVLQGSAGAFDILSYGMPSDIPPEQTTGGLAFSNLQINLSSPTSTPNVVTYTIGENALAFDKANSTLRYHSPTSAQRAAILVSGLALQPAEFLVSDGTKQPADFGFLPVQLDTGDPNTQGPSLVELSGPWYGVSYLINMGGPGALASSAGFTSHLLLAWSPQSVPGDTSYSVFTGLNLPGAAPGASVFSVQGVLKLTVGSISLLYGPVKPSGCAFTLRLDDIALKFLGFFKLPPNASIDLFLFGDPAGTGSPGWYGAYVENTAKKSQTSANILPPTQAAS